MSTQRLFWSSEDRFLNKVLYVSGAVFLLSLVSQLSIPLNPVPITFQVPTVLLIGIVLGARLGVYAIVTYLVAGLLGLPVFADFSAGPHVFVGPTAGYLIGWIPAVALSGWFAQKGYTKSVVSCFVSSLCSTVIIFAFGVAYLAHLIGWEKAVQFGVVPFVVTGLVKLVVFSLFVPRLGKHE